MVRILYDIDSGDGVLGRNHSKLWVLPYLLSLLLDQSITDIPKQPF